eukprot:TRINITY_DN11306_c0_g1_i1.p1 TRINITY_DN11306_c0_g1~~TRINITY_DN11306_c0_g1_i1.p1  ORF type:complete len:448 (+),score=83.24 TRINITY_DN11306_c0_g1_i1:194-1537(+)
MEGNLGGDPDALARKKRSDVLGERLKSRQEKRTERKESSNTTTRRDEASSCMLSFDKEKAEIADCLSTILRAFNSKPGCDSSMSSASRPTPTSSVHALSVRVDQLQTLLSQNADSLSAYDLQHSQKAVDSLREDINAALGLVKPRGKFSFRSRRDRKPSPSPVVVATSSSAPAPASTSPSSPPSTPSESPPVASLSSLQTSSAQVIQYRSDTMFVAPPCDEDAPLSFSTTPASPTTPISSPSSPSSSISPPMSDRVISHMEDAVVCICQPSSSVHMHHMRRCLVILGPVMGSVLMDDCENCVFMIATHQIRIHSSKHCDFYLRMKSRPIIEECSSLRFAPLMLQYPSYERQLEDSNLCDKLDSTLGQLWSAVDDFRWMKQGTSPNWTILPTDSRVDVCVEKNSTNSSNGKDGGGNACWMRVSDASSATVLMEFDITTSRGDIKHILP